MMANGPVVMVVDDDRNEIVLVINGDVSIIAGADTLELHQGEASFITNHQSVSLNAISKTYLFRASVPVHSGE
jgi:mannose-6-phosphate isomerase class I